MITLRALVALVSVILIGASPVPTPKEQCQRLLDTVLPLAERFLKEDGEFFPFGASIKSDGRIVLAAAYEGTERPPSATLIKMLHDVFHAGATKSTHVATALAYDVRVVPPGTNVKTDAVAVELDHRDDYSVVVYSPYKIVSGVVEFGATFANPGEKRIFQRHGG